MSKNTIKIDGAKLKSLLEYQAKKTLYEISEDEGFSRNFLSQACRSGKASPIVQAVARNYGVEPEQYKLKEKELTQMSIEDIEKERESWDALNKTVSVSRETYNKLSEITDKAADDIARAFEELKEAWTKAVYDYSNEIEKIKEGKK